MKGADGVWSGGRGRDAEIVIHLRRGHGHGHGRQPHPASDPPFPPDPPQKAVKHNSAMSEDKTCDSDSCH
jgi:hypothetical protein